MNIENVYSTEFDDDDIGGFYKDITGEESKKKPVGDAEGEENSGAPETPAGGEEGAEGASEAPGEGEESAPGEPGDDDEIELKVGDKTEKVKVGDVKKLLASKPEIEAQRASLTEAHSKARAETERATVVLNKMLERAQARFAPYKDLDLILLSRQVDDATFTQIRKDMQDAENDVRFFSQELNTVNEAARVQQQQAITEASKLALSQINDAKSPNHIPNFDKAVYQEMIDFAEKQGVSREAALAITDASALKIIHMALQYARGAKSATTTVKPVVRTPTKVLKPAASSATKPDKTDKAAAIKALRRSGSEDDAVAAFVASFGGEE